MVDNSPVAHPDLTDTKAGSVVEVPRQAHADENTIGG